MITLKNSLKASVLIVTTAILSGCVPHLTEQQCQTMNWYQLGFTDGSQGKSQRDLSRDIQDCAKFQLKVNTRRYAQGWRAGTRQYCQPSTAYQLGLNGQPYNHICPADLAASFNSAWKRGLHKYCIPSTGYNLGRAGKPMPSFCSGGQAVRFRNAYQEGYRQFQAQQDAQAQVNNTQRQIFNTQRQIRNRQIKISRLENQLKSGKDDNGNKLTPQERRNMRNRIRFLRNDIFAMRNHVNQLNRQLGHEQQQLINIRTN